MLCGCGCGQDAGIYTGWPNKGKERPYVRGHWNHRRRISDITPPNPEGLCQCGCGRKTGIARQSNRKTGAVVGEHLRYWRHHGAFATRRTEITPDMWRVEDRGYTSPCWIATGGSFNQFGHHKTTVNGNVIGTHRAMYEQEVGQIPEGLELDHLCKQPSCIRPDHLEPVTHAENIRRSPLAKLTRDDVIAIRASTEAGQVLADQFSVSRQTIYDIRRRKSWADV